MSQPLHEITTRASTWVELLRERAQIHPNRRAITFLPDGEKEGATLSYAQLDERARLLAAQLQAQGAQGERVMLVLPSGIEYIVAFCGCLYAGAVAVPAYPPRLNRNLSRLQTIAQDCQPALALSAPEIFARIQPALPGSGLEELRWFLPDAVPTGSEAWQEPELSGQSLAFLQYTSGSTAAPKGVQITHGNLLANHRMIAAAFEQREELTVVSWLPLFHDMGLIGNLLQALFGGDHCVLMPPEAFLLKPVRWLRAISHYRSEGGGPNFAFDLCAQKTTPEQREGLDLSCWTLAFCGAEPIRTEILDRFAQTFAPYGFEKSAFYPCYGLAEATLFACGGLKSTVATFASFDAAGLERDRAVPATPNGAAPSRTLVSCGRPWLNGEVAIVNAVSFSPCEQGEVGEVWIRGPHVAAGYWNRPEETEHTFGARDANGEGPFLRTGDLGFYYRSELYLTGRLKDLIIVGGRNHYPDDIEASVTASHEALHGGGCAAFSIEIQNAEALSVVAEVGRTHLSSLNSAAVVQAIRQAVAEHHDLRAHTVRLVKPATLPKTSSGKVQRGATKAMFLNHTLTEVGT